MIDRRRRSPRPDCLLEPLEPRTLLSTSHAVLVMQAPILPAQPVQTDKPATPTPVPAETLGYASVIDAQVRIVPGGAYLSIAASSAEIRPEAPSGTVDIYEGLKYVTTIALGSVQRNTIVLPAGIHTILVTYKGDANFGPSQTAVTARLTSPTNTPVTPEQAANFPTNKSGERVRPMRFLSKVDYFAAQGMTVATPNPQAAAIPTPGSETSTDAANPPIPLVAMPTPRFANVSFLVKLPPVTVRK